jgi:hypothetical protein
MDNGQIDWIKPSLLTFLSYIPLSRADKQDRALIALADYAASSQTARRRLRSTVLLRPYLAKLSQFQSTRPNYDSLCFILLSLMELDMGTISQIKRDSDLSVLFELVFDIDVRERTRILVAAILSCVVQQVTSIRPVMSTAKFFKKFKSLVPISSPDFLLWQLILIKRTYDMQSIDLAVFYNESVHILVAELVLHRANEIRAAAIACLSCFMQGSVSALNRQLVLMVLPALVDMSYLVRYQLLIFVVRFLSSHQQEYLGSQHKVHKIQTHTSFAAILSGWLMRPIRWPDIDFCDFATWCDGVVHKVDAQEHICNLVFSVIDFFTRDSHPAIRASAVKARSSFQKLTHSAHEKNSSGSSHSISPPFGDLELRPPVPRDESSDSTISDDAPLFETDSNALTSIFLRDLVDSKGCSRTQKTSNISQTPANFGVVSIPGAHLQLRSINRQGRATPVQLAYHHCNPSIAMATSQRSLCHMDENLGSVQQIQIPDSDISDLHWTDFNGVSYVVACTSDGCTHLWIPGSTKLAATWRTDANYVCDNLPQLAAVTPHSPVIITARGNGGIGLWDLETQQLAGEWNFHEANVVTTLCFRLDNPNIAIAGYSNGSIAAIDMRISGADDASKFWYINIGDRVVQIRENRNGRERMYAASSSGKVFIWDAVSHRLEPSLNLKTTVDSFDLHSALPIAAVGRPKERPTLYRSTDMLPLCSAKDVDPGSIFAFSPILPTITFGLPNGHVISYDIALDAEQK